MPVPDTSVVLCDGPWRHREVSANGIRLHVAEAGSGPLVLLLHGFPEYWWAWRHQLVGLAEAGYRVVAPDLRGQGGSDKPPRGYDALTLADDMAGLIRALGEHRATVVGHSYGGTLAWTVATTHPRLVRRLAVLAAPHPLRLRAALARGPRGQLSASWHTAVYQIPRYPESLLTRNDATYLTDLFTAWSGPRWRRDEDFVDAVRRYRAAIRIPAAAHCALECYRWSVRSSVRPDGWRYAKLMRQPVTAPTLQLHGAADPRILPSTAQGSGRYVAAEYEWRMLPEVGHFLPEEAPEAVTGELLRWLKEG